MAQDAELDRLKDALDRAFQTKQDAWEAQNKAWGRRSEAREAMDRAYQDKQRAYEVQNASWEDYQRVRSYNGPRIDQLNAAQEAAFENMKRSFDLASDAHDSHDGLSARSYADQGHSYKAESQSAVAERRQLVEEIRNARARHEDTKPAFQRAKADFDSAKQSFDRAKAEHDQAQAQFKQAKANFERAKEAFQSRLEVLKSQTRQRKADYRSLAQQAGVPSEYLDDIYVSTDSDGTINIYFGGIGEPNGEGHGHYVMDSSGNVTYRRDPFDPHGTQNFTDSDRTSSWTPRGSQSPDVGVIAGTNHLVSFKTGGKTGDQTLIADGDLSDNPKEFDAKHNHYGSKVEGGQIDEDRGHYTGPDH